MFFKNNDSDIKILEKYINDNCNKKTEEVDYIKKILNRIKNKLKFYKLSVYKDDLTNLFNQKFYNIYINSNFFVRRKEEKEILFQFIEYIKNNNLDCLMFIDFANFKYINDNYGYEKGDLVLEFFGSFINNYDLFGIRRGGDEFIIFGNKNIIYSVSTILNSYNFLKIINKSIGIDEIITYPIFSYKVFNPKNLDIDNFKNKISALLKELELDYHIKKPKIKQKFLNRLNNKNDLINYINKREKRI